MAQAAAAGHGPHRRHGRADRRQAAAAPVPGRREPRGRAVRGAPRHPTGRGADLDRATAQRRGARQAGRLLHTCRRRSSRRAATVRTARPSWSQPEPCGSAVWPTPAEPRGVREHRTHRSGIRGWLPAGSESSDTWPPPEAGRRNAGVAATTGCADRDGVGEAATIWPHTRGSGWRTAHCREAPPRRSHRSGPGRTEARRCRSRRTLREDE